MVLVGALSVPLAWLGWKIEKQRHERELVASIQKVGGNVRYDFEVEDRMPWHRNWLGRLFGEDFLAEVADVTLCGPRGNQVAGGPTDNQLAGLADLANLPRLKTLRLYSFSATNAGLAHIANIKSIEKLWIAGAQITDEGLVHIGAMTNLGRLRLSHTRIKGAGLAELNRCKNLTCLYIDDSPEFTDNGLVALREIPGLTRFSLHGGRITNAGLLALKDVHGLEHLELSSTSVTDEGLQALRHLKNLTSLRLSGHRFTDLALAPVKELTRLRSLRLADASITGTGLESVRKLSHLEEIDLFSTDILAPFHLGILRDVNTLVVLNLCNTGIRDHDLVHLKGLTGLKELHLLGNHVTDAGEAELQMALVSCKITR